MTTAGVSAGLKNAQKTLKKADRGAHLAKTNLYTRIYVFGEGVLILECDSEG